MTRRCFFAAAGLSAAAGAAAAAESDAETAHLPKATVLFSGGDTKTYLLVYCTGQEVMKGLLAFARKHRLVAGYVTGIGAISDAVVGYFDPEKKSYQRLRQPQQAEVLSMTGNLTLFANKPFFHVHTALNRADGTAHGGHLFEAIVCPTVELMLTASSRPGRPVRRKTDSKTGLPLIDL